jgi:TusA-related sulfurtransferase
VLWSGQQVLLTLDGKILTVLRATASVRVNIEAWCFKNSYRCTQIHDGKIWL